VRLASASLLLICPCRLVAGQNNPAAAQSLTRIERSIEQGRIDEIERPLLDYAIAHPADARALYLLAQVRYRQGRYKEAKALFQRVVALDPTLARAQVFLGQSLYVLGEQDEARRLLVSITQRPIREPLVQLALADALALVGEFRGALAAVEKLPVALRNVEALPVTASSYLALGERQKLNALVPSMRRAATVKPFVAAQCAEVLKKAGMSEQATGLLRLALQSAPDDAGLLVALGRLEVDAKDFTRARLHLQRASTLDARNADALAASALLESAEGNFAAALTSIEKARALSPDSLSILTQFVLTAMRANRPQAAVEAAGALIRLKPDEPEFVYLSGAALLQQGSLNAAQNALERYAKERPADSRGCLALGITLASQRDQPEAARAQFERCLELDPANTEAKYQLGLVCKSQGDTARAVELLEDVTTRSPRHAQALRELGALYFQTGADARARDVLERAVAIDPQDAETHFQLGRLYNRTGQSALAQHHLSLFQKLKSLRDKGAQQ
jgi:Flp pilus assembly protein TadD